MNLDELTLGDVKKLKCLLGQAPESTACCDDGGIRICVLQRGWVVVGRFSQQGSECKLKDANVIRTWGTSKGLGEIAENGPVKDKTILDACPDVIFHELVGVFQIQCKAAKWESKLR